MTVRRCLACGKRTRAELPAGVPRRPFGPRLTAVVALLSGRYRLSRREVRQMLEDLWAVRVSLGAVVRQERAQSAVQQADVVNMDETGWRQAKQRAWLWTVVTADLRAVAPLPRRGVRPGGTAATADPARGPTGAAAAARAEEPRREIGGAVPRAEEVVDGPLDLRTGAGRG